MPGSELDIAAVYDDFDRVMEDAAVSPEDFTLALYRKYGGKYDGRTLRRIGGFEKLVATGYITKPIKELVQKREVSKRHAYVQSLETKVSNQAIAINEFNEGWRRAIDDMGALVVSKLNKPLISKKTPKERANIAFISDIHLGLDIDVDEVGNNAYDWVIGARRLGKYADQVASYKIDHRDECPTLHVCLGGDLGQGVIHPDDRADAVTYQCYGITKYLVSMIDFWRHHYKNIVVEFTPDNHMRMPHRGPDRNFNRKWDNFSTFGVLQPLQYAFRDQPDVEFHVTKNGISTFNVLGHKFGMTHGDTHIYSGNVSKTLDVKNIANQILKLNAAQTDGRAYDAMLLGHVHTALYMQLNEAQTSLVVNGTGSGTDGYATSNGFFRTRPQQVLMESTRQYAIGDFRIVSLEDADHNPKYDAIIKPYERKLTIGD